MFSRRRRRLAERQFRKAQHTSAVKRRKHADEAPTELQLETLEPRVLLTTLVGGDVFDYIDAEGNTVRVAIDGDIIAELIGADVDGTEVMFGDLPGIFRSSDIGRAGTEVGGGLGGADGTDLLSKISIIDPGGLSVAIPFSADGNDAIDIQALASDASGNTYAFNLATVDDGGTDRQVVQFLQIDAATGVATVLADFAAAPDLADAKSILAADVNTAGTHLYFVAAIGDGEADTLFEIDLADPAFNPVRKGQITATAGHEITSIAFEENNGVETLYAFRSTDSAGQIVTLDTTNATIASVGPTITLDGEAVTGITGIEFVNDDPSSGERYLYAVDGEGKQLLRIDLATGRSFKLGDLPDPDDTTGDVRGDALGGLSWDATMINPFTGELGTLLATDTETDELVALDHRPRFPEADAFVIYVSQGDPNGSISITVLDDEGQPVPYGDSRDIRVLPAQGGDAIVVSAPGGSGGVYIGAQTEDYDSAADDEDLRPIIEALIDQTIGVRAKGVGDLWAGLHVGESLLDFVSSGSNWQDRLMGMNFDNVQALTMSHDGTALVAIDVDGSDQTGSTINGDQLALINPVTGKAGVPVAVVDAGTGDPLRHVQGLDWGDVDFDGTEELYAIYNLIDLDGDTIADPTLGIIDPLTGEFTAIGAISDAGAPISEVQAMAFDRANGVIYIVDGNATLHQINPATGAIVASAAIVDANVVDEFGIPVPLNIKSMDFVANGQLLAHDVDNGRLVDIDFRAIASGTVTAGGSVATTAGSLRPTVGAITYDDARDRFVAADNVTGILPVNNEALDSAVLMALVGYQSDSAQVQDLGQFLVGGTLTGKVDVSGSVDTFYAGWLITGDTGGISEGSSGTIDRDFQIGGDLRNLIVFGSIGSDGGGTIDEPTYLTGMDMYVGGRVGQILTFDRFNASIEVGNLESLPSGFTYQDRPASEYETHQTASSQSPEATSWSNFELWAADGRFSNDTFETAQRLGSLRDAGGGEYQILVQGALDSSESVNDGVDYYAVALMAGQTVTVHLTVPSGAVGVVRVGIFDPDGRLIAADYSNVADSEAANKPFQFTADRPGEYRFAVALMGDTEFTGSSETPGAASYELRISDIGDIALGGIVAATDIYNSNTRSDRGVIHVRKGDIGGIYAGGTIGFEGFSPNIVADTGNLRSIDASQVGMIFANGLFGGGPNIDLEEGSIGLIRSRDDLGYVYARIGGDLQVVDVKEVLYLNLEADGGVGVIRAGSMATTLITSWIVVNADGVGQDGIIDLIDVAGDFGTIEMGGPQITTNGGNVRYIRVGGAVFQDVWFGGGQPTQTSHNGTPVTLIDDGGGTIVLDPGKLDVNPFFNPQDPNSKEFIYSNLTVTTYGIRGSGGSVLVKVETDGSLAVIGRGAGGKPVEVSEVIVTGSRGGFELDPQGNIHYVNNDAVNLNLRFEGNTDVDVFAIRGANSILTSVTNATQGELVNMLIGGAGRVETHGNLGLAKQHTGAAVLGNLDSAHGQAASALAFPFNQQRNGIISGSIAELISHKGMGNIAITGAVDKITADAGRVNDPSQFEGINGVVLINGNVRHVDIGEGILPSGSGNLAHAGLFVDGTIGKVSGTNADIRGDIVATGSIGAIELNNGAIINADIMVVDSLDQSREFNSEFVLPEATDAFGRPVFEIGQITVRGANSGIIGAAIMAADVGKIRVEKGFGFFNSWVSVLGEGMIDDVIVDGFGIRGVTFDGGATQGNITATGRGETLRVTDFGQSVRLSETASVDPYFGTSINSLTDIHQFLGTSTLDPGVTDIGAAGIIQNVVGRASRDLGMVQAWQIVTSQFNYANSIKGFQTIDDINGLGIVTGSLGTFKPGADVYSLDMTVAGPIKSILINGELKDSSVIRAIGPNGYIQSLTVKGDMEGDILASAYIGRIQIAGNLEGSITVLNGDSRGMGLQMLKLGGSMANGSLDINGDVKSIDIAGSLGDSADPTIADQLMIRGDLGQLRVGTDRNVHGSELALDVIVLGDLGKLDVMGALTGSIAVTGNAKSITIQADDITQGTAIVHNAAGVLAVSVGGELSAFRVTGGDVGDGAGMGVNITAGAGIKRFDIKDGNLALDAVVTAAFGDIGNFTIVGGDLLGGVHAPNGEIRSLMVRGSDVGGHITAASMRTFRIDGSLLAGSTIDIDGEVANFTVNQAVQAGAIVDIGSARRLQIGSTMDGTLTVQSGPTQLNLMDSVGGDITLGGEAQITVRGDVLDSATIQINHDLRDLRITGNLLGDVIVTGSARSITADGLDGAVLAIGLDLDQLTVRNDIVASMIQVGLSAGDDGVFGTGDAGEASRMANIGKLTAGNLISSVIAAGGHIGSVTIKDAVQDSSVSAGLSVGGTAMAQVLDGTLDLTNAGDRDTARGSADRVLMAGSIDQFTASQLINSSITAGVDAGNDGSFDPSAGDGVDVTRSITGGRSVIGRLTVRDTIDVNSHVVTDAGVERLSVGTNLGQVVEVDYALADLTGNNALETLVGTATQANTITVNGITIQIQGNVTIEVRDDSGVAGRIDSLVIQGNDPRARVTITGGGEIGRVLTADDVQLGQFTYDGDIAGDGSDDPDLWLDGGVDTFSINTMGDPTDLAGSTTWAGHIGGSVKDLAIATQGPGMLRIAGSVNSLVIGGSLGNSLLSPTAAASLDSIAQMAVSNVGDVWVFDADTAQIAQVDVNNDNTLIGAPMNVTDVMDPGAALRLLGLDFDAAGTLFAVAELPDMNPVQVAAMLPDGLVLTGMTVNSQGMIFAIDSSQNIDSVAGLDDRLIMINPSTGAVTPIGVLQDIFGHTYSGNVQSLAFDDADNLYVLLNDRDGIFGTNSPADGVALAKLTSTGAKDAQGNVIYRAANPQNSGQPALFLAGGGVTDNFIGMAIDGSGNIYAVRDDGGANTLVQINSTTGVVTDLGAIEVGGSATSIAGISFDADDNLFALDKAGAAGQVLRIDLADPTNLTVAVGAPQASLDIDAFAVSRSGSDTTVYAYDFDSPGNSRLFSSIGVTSPTLGTIDTATGEFTRLGALLGGTPGLPTALGSSVLGMTVDNAGTGNVFLLTDDGRLIEYQTDGTLVGEVGTIVAAGSGQRLQITAIEFDDATGELIGLDARYNRLVTIDTTTGEATPRHEAGLIDASTLQALAFDPATGQFRSVQDDAGSDQFVIVTDEMPTDSMGRIIATSYSKVDLTNGYSGRIEATGNTFVQVTAAGDFDGRLITAGSVRSFQIADGDFGGAILARGDLDRFDLSNGDFLATSQLDIGGRIGVLAIKGGASSNGDLHGVISAGTAGTLTIAGSGSSTAQLLIDGQADSVTIGGDFAGLIELGSVGRSFSLAGHLTSSDSILIAGHAQSFSIGGDVASDSTVLIGGGVKKLDVGGTHRGTLAVRGGVQNAGFGSIDGGIVTIAQDTRALSVNGNVTNSVISFGTWVGEDGVYNTEDDVIIGGSAGNVAIRGNVAASAIVAGVLPDISYGPGVPSSLKAYTGNQALFNTPLHDLTQVDSAEVGGILPSDIQSLTVSGWVQPAGSGTAQNSVVAVAGEIGRMTGSSVGNFVVRQYDSPFNPPTVQAVNVINDNEFQVVFSDLIDTSSLILSRDANNDGDLDDPQDVVGTITLRTGTGIIDRDDNVRLAYTTRTDGDGHTYGVLRVIKSDGFDPGVLQVELSGDLNGPAIHGISSLRSAMRDFNQDGTTEVGESPIGTILDGDRNGAEGGSSIVQLTMGDVADSFLGALGGLPVPVITDGGTVQLSGTFEAGGSDIDVFHFTATEFEFLSVEVLSDTWTAMGLFFQDDQGTADPNDDTFELLTRIEDNWLGDNLFQAIELARTGNYFLVVTGGIDAASPYTINFTLASSDVNLVNALGGEIPHDDRIAYVSNVIGENNNHLGANTPKQLVYINIDGGVSNKTELGQVRFNPFDTTAMDLSLDSGELIDTLDLQTAMLYGDISAGITGILSHLVSIFTDLPATAGAIDVQAIGANFSAFATALDGLFFTTVDPTLHGYDANSDFATIHLGHTNSGYGFFLHGLASHVDEYNMDKADEAVIFVESFANLATGASTVDRLNEYSVALANVIGHELGHLLGLWHHPTNRFDYVLHADDPNNDDSDGSDANTGVSLMAYQPLNVLFSGLSQLGTHKIDRASFPIGDVDHVDQLLLALA